MLSFTKEETIAIEQEIVKLCEEYPYGKYIKTQGPGPTCMYTKGVVMNGPETQGCVVGQAISRVCPDKFRYCVVKENSGGNISPAYILFNSDFISSVQSNQDDGNTWGESLRLAKSYLP